MIQDALRQRLAQLANRAAELEGLLSDPDVLGDQARYTRCAKEYAFASRAAEKLRSLESLERRGAEAAEMLEADADEELTELARQEIEDVEDERLGLDQEVQELLLEDDEDARRDAIVEIRAGTGGDEAALFVGDLFHMYSKFAETRRWKTEIVSSHPTELGGFRDITFDVKGNGVYGVLRHESGGHRVQRVPSTESSGRIHTSAVTVAVLPEAEAVDVEIADEDVKIDRFCASGPGGQHVNRTESAIRLTHLPTGMVVSCQDEKSQHKNLAKAMRVLRSRLYERKLQEEKQARDAMRNAQIGSGDRSERIRTYNFPQNRVTDHRLGKNYSLEQVMPGDLSKIVADLREMDREQQLAALATPEPEEVAQDA
jgi:peptide chain release factor 1